MEPDDTYPAAITDAEIDQIARKRWGRKGGDDGAQEMRIWLWQQTEKRGSHTKSWYLERAVRAAEDAHERFAHERAPVCVQNFTDVGLSPMGEPMGDE